MKQESTNEHKEEMAADNHIAEEQVQQQENNSPAQPSEQADADGKEPDTADAQAEATDADGKNDKLAEELQAAQEQIDQLKDQLLRQMAEFDNFRKRTLKEKSELILNGGQKVLESLLPVLDDLERAEANIEKSDEIQTLKEGVHLILNKLTKALSAHGLKKMETAGAPFDTDFHEAIALVPAQDDSQKNHIIDCVQPGYMLNEKVLRHAKVVVGQ